MLQSGTAPERQSLTIGPIIHHNELHSPNSRILQNLMSQLFQHCIFYFCNKAFQTQHSIINHRKSGSRAYVGATRMMLNTEHQSPRAINSAPKQSITEIIQQSAHKCYYSVKPCHALNHF